MKRAILITAFLLASTAQVRAVSGSASNLTATCIGSTQTKLSWTAAPNATSYQAGWCAQTAGCQAQQYSSLNTSGTSVTINTTCDQWYGWWVYAYPGTAKTDAPAWSKCPCPTNTPTPTPTPTVCSCPSPAAPSNVRTTSCTPYYCYGDPNYVGGCPAEAMTRSVSLAWNDNATNETRYNLYAFHGAPNYLYTTFPANSTAGTITIDGVTTLQDISAFRDCGGCTGESTRVAIPACPRPTPNLNNCSNKISYEIGTNQFSLNNQWAYTTFTANASGTVTKINVKAGNYGGAQRSLTCKVTNNGGGDISATKASAVFTSSSGAAWRTIDFKSNPFTIQRGTTYRLYCKGPDTWNSLYWVYNYASNIKDYQIFFCPAN